MSKPLDKTGLYPPFAEAVSKMEVQANKIGAFLFDGFRSFEEQMVLYAKGREFISPTGQWIVTNPRLVVTKAIPGLSAHNYGIGSDWAFDADLVKPGIQWSWDNHYPWNQLGVIGKSLGFEWGFNWVSFPEQPHFQMLYGLKMSDLLPILKSQGLPAVWALFDKARKIIV
jgi:peptidoglycan L-alanyl-D-glutamate endopeptidase CwlK